MDKNDIAIIKSKRKSELIGKSYTTACGMLIIILTLSIFFFIASKGVATFTTDHVSIFDFLFSSTWAPEKIGSRGQPYVGAAIFIAGSIIVSIFAVLVSTPISICSAVFMTEISPKLGEKFLRPAIELFAGIPSVVYGWIGLSILVPFLRNTVGGLGFSLLAAGIVLTIMIFPTIASVAADSLRVLPSDYREAAYALGATRWQTIKGVLIPAALPQIFTGVVLGMARAFGEALAVQMVIGNSIKFPQGLTDPTITLTSIITMDMGNTVAGSAWNNALWSMALLLLLISFGFIILIRRISKRGD
ncbi:MAG TPA: phosphate ABC transporter permease subunit PstC [Clostridiaceae bacterium]|nr:phosphate ABC transporter permease subunit PstC [Clostridiaceae bacterium]